MTQNFWILAELTFLLEISIKLVLKREQKFILQMSGRANFDYSNEIG